MNRGIALVESYTIFKNQDTTEDDIKIAIALGWAVEMVELKSSVLNISTIYAVVNFPLIGV